MNEGAAVRHFRELMISPVLDAIKARLTLSCNDANMHEGTIIDYAKVVS